MIYELMCSIVLYTEDCQLPRRWFLFAAYESIFDDTLSLTHYDLQTDLGGFTLVRSLCL